VEAAARYDVTKLREMAVKDYVTSRHYSGTYPAAAQRYGLLDVAGGGEPRLVGVAVLSIPPQARVLTQVFPGLHPCLNYATSWTHWCCLPCRLPVGLVAATG
jgi:hypothetical protein